MRIKQGKSNTRLKPVMATVGAFISYSIGAGFASGNEILQFFGSWGLPRSILAIIGGTAATMSYCALVYYLGQKFPFEKTSDSYLFIGGKGLGWFLQIYGFVFIFGCFMLMFSGAGSLMNQQFGTPNWFGSVLLGVVTAVITLGGLKSVENVLGGAGIVILIYVIIFGIISIFHPASSFENAGMAESAVEQGQILQANLFAQPPFRWIPGLDQLNSPLMEGILYATMCLTSGFPFYYTLGNRSKDSKEAVVSGVLSGVGVYICVTFILIMMLTNFNALINPATNQMYAFPALAALDNMWPAGSWTYSVIIFVGVFTTATGYMWVINDWFFAGQEKTKKSQLFIVGMLVFGVLLGGILPFSTIINFLFPITGFIGIIMTIVLLVKVIKHKQEEKAVKTKVVKQSHKTKAMKTES